MCWSNFICLFYFFVVLFNQHDLTVQQVVNQQARLGNPSVNATIEQNLTDVGSENESDSSSNFQTPASEHASTTVIQVDTQKNTGMHDTNPEQVSSAVAETQEPAGEAATTAGTTENQAAENEGENPAAQNSGAQNSENNGQPIARGNPVSSSAMPKLNMTTNTYNKNSALDLHATPSKNRAHGNKADWAFMILSVVMLVFA